MVVYLTGIYADEETRRAFEAAYKATGKRYDVGKSCVRFRRLQDLPLQLIGASIASMDVQAFVARVEKTRSAGKSRG